MDISKCDGARREEDGGGWKIVACPLRDNCLRFTAPATLYQSWVEAKYNPEKGDCWNLLMSKSVEKIRGCVR